MNDYHNNFARYYDLLTGHKDYETEVSLLLNFLNQEGFGLETNLLSIGCGTGNHEYLLASKINRVVGIDKSSQMINYARKKSPPKNLTFFDGDLQRLECSNFDVIISLYNVVNCIGDLDCLRVFFQSIAQKTANGGIVLLEVWNSTQVTLNPPKRVDRSYVKGDTFLSRTVTPFLDPHNSFLRLDYQVSGYECAQPVNFQSTHDIYLHARNLIEYCLLNVGFSRISWYSALSEGIRYASEKDRMLLVKARKIV